MKTAFSALLAAAALSLGACATTDDYAESDYDRDATLEGAGTGAAIGAVAGAGAGAVIEGLSPIEGAVIGAVVGGLAGAVWADRDGDGHADGYYRNGTYYEGRPPPPPPYEAPVTRSGERGR